jgi:hypothetical protein
MIYEASLHCLRCGRAETVNVESNKSSGSTSSVLTVQRSSKASSVSHHSRFSGGDVIDDRTIERSTIDHRPSTIDHILNQKITRLDIFVSIYSAQRSRPNAIF